MEKNKELELAFEIEERPRTSSNNQQIVQIKYVPLNEKEQIEVENLFKVN